MFDAVKKSWFMSKAFLALETRHGIKFSPFDPGYDSLAEAMNEYRRQGATPQQAADALIAQLFPRSGDQLS